MNMISSTTKKMLALSMLSGVGPATLRKVAAQNLVFASVDVLSEKISAIARALSTPDAWEVAQELAEKQCDAAEKADARIICALDEAYPALLSATKDDPFLIYVKGQLSLTPLKSVAIIGTREPTKHGELIARRVTEFFTDQCWSVVSGLALGCDALAHRAAIDSKGHTVAVLAHGLQTVAPSQHRKLAQEILDSGGALVSEYRFGQGALPTQFVKRDRTQAGLAQGVVMIQSDIKGGSLHASRAALDYERWLAVPFPTDADQASNEPKIQANLLIADSGADIERATLLKCHRGRLSRVIVLRTKDDYSKMASATFGGNVISSADAGGGDQAFKSEGIVKQCEAAELNLGTTAEIFPEQDKRAVEAPSQDGNDCKAIDILECSELQPGTVKLAGESAKEQQQVAQADVVEATSEAPKKSKAKCKNKTVVKGELTVQQNLL
jgi:DNA processing protein